MLRTTVQLMMGPLIKESKKNKKIDEKSENFIKTFRKNLKAAES